MQKRKLIKLVVVIIFLYRLNQRPHWSFLRLVRWCHFFFDSESIKPETGLEGQQPSPIKPLLFIVELQLYADGEALFKQNPLSDSTLSWRHAIGRIPISLAAHFIFVHKVPYQARAECRLLGRVLACRSPLLKSCQILAWYFLWGRLSLYPHIVAHIGPCSICYNESWCVCVYVCFTAARYL